MFERLDEIIDKNLKLIFESKSQSSIRLYDLENKSYNNNDTKRLAKIMQDKELVFAADRKCDIAPLGLIVSKEGGWLTHLANKAKIGTEQQTKVDTKEQLETDLAKSNIEANKLNAKIAEQNSQNESKNRIAMWVNISVGVVNTVLLAIQIWLIVRK